MVVRNPERLSAQDASFLTLEEGGTAMNVGGLAMLRPPTGRNLDQACVRRVVAGRIDRMPRLRQRLAEVPGGGARPRWVEDLRFDLHAHVRAATLPAPGSPAQLARAAHSWVATPMSRDRPLWDMTLFNGLADGRAALLIRCHHAMVDGMSGVELARVLFDRDPSAPAGDGRPGPVTEPPDAEELVDEAAVERWADGLESQWNDLVDAYDPVGRIDRTMTLLDGIRDFVAAGPKDPAPFGRSSGLPSRLAMGEHPGAPLRALRRATGVSEHALAASLAAGALARYAATLPPGRRPDRLRALLPVMIPVRDRRSRLGNHASFLIVDLPVGPMAEHDRLRLVAGAFEAARASGQAAASARLMELSDRASPSLGATIARVLSRVELVDVVLSFMRGPRSPLYLSGVPLDCIVPILPLGRGVAAMFGLGNLGGSWSWGLTVDPGRVTAPEYVAAAVPRVAASLSAASLSGAAVGS